MRSGIIYAAICLSLAAFGQANPTTVTEFRTITTTLYEHEKGGDAKPTPTHGADNGGLTDAPGPAPQPTEPPKVGAAPPKDGPPKGGPEPPKGAPQPPKGDPSPPKDGQPPKGGPEPPKGPEPPMNGQPPKGGPEPPKSGPEPPKGSPEPPKNEPGKPGNAPPPPPPPAKGTNTPPPPPPIGNKVKPSAGASASGKSSAATDFTFSPITLAPESSQSGRPTSLRELTASNRATHASASHNNASSARYALSFGTVAGMTMMGVVASALVQL